ncbi:MAG: hypothetical protein TREMPRED_001239, partial [Tremellales sp. Tagirdzhanova-0007]
MPIPTIEARPVLLHNSSSSSSGYFTPDNYTPGTQSVDLPATPLSMIPNLKRLHGMKPAFDYFDPQTRSASTSAASSPRGSTASFRPGIGKQTSSTMDTIASGLNRTELSKGRRQSDVGLGTPGSVQYQTQTRNASAGLSVEHRSRIPRPSLSGPRPNIRQTSSPPSSRASSSASTSRAFTPPRTPAPVVWSSASDTNHNQPPRPSPASTQLSIAIVEPSPISPGPSGPSLNQRRSYDQGGAASAPHHPLPSAAGSHSVTDQLSSTPPSPTSLSAHQYQPGDSVPVYGSHHRSVDSSSVVSLTELDGIDEIDLTSSRSASNASSNQPFPTFKSQPFKIEIPKRQSSVSLKSVAISPRSSSMAAFTPPDEDSRPGPPRRASKTIALGEA